ncbi:hypothetical protein Tco_0705977 [Tanacetum coccineum]|uniref:Uncharacterized protein n=1 Tax=Tanacetum coccineum TaxID=301880 RepID=A0ABQ4Y676_9ASTR
MLYPHQRYAVYNTLVNEEQPPGFTSIRRIHQEDTAYPWPNFTKTSMTRRLNTPYPEAFIRRIERRLMNILLAIGSSPGRNDGTARPVLSWENSAFVVDDKVLHKIVDVVEKSRIVEQLVKAVADNEKNCIEIDGCFDMTVCDDS